jgi:hypothetical protein
MAVIPAPPHPIIELPLPSLDGKVLWIEDRVLAAEISTGLEVGAPEIFAALALGGLTYSVADWLFPQTAAVYNEGNNWYDKIVNLRARLQSPAFKGVTKWVTASVTDGLYSRDPQLTKMLLATAHAVHDFTVEVGHFADTEAQAMHQLRYVTVPREIRYYTKPLRLRIGTIELVIKAWRKIAHQLGYPTITAMFRAWGKINLEVGKAITYVHHQGHPTLAGALSVYEARAKQVAKMEATAQQLGFYTVPDLERFVVTQTKTVLPKRIGKIELGLKQLRLKLKPLLELAPVDLGILASLGTLAGFEAMVNRILPRTCTATGECAAGNLVGKSNWNIFKGLLNLLLFGALDALLAAELCTIVGAVKEGIDLAKPALREIAVVEGGLFSIGCAGKTPPLPPPAYT